jgi:hypothetical protein
MRRQWLVGLLLIVAWGTIGPGRTLAQAADVLERYLPPAAELPPRFEHRPELDERVDEADRLIVIRSYIRMNPEVGPDDGTLLQVLAAVNPSGPVASLYPAIVDAWTEGGYRCSQLLGGPGDQANVCRARFDTDSERPSEGVWVLFRSGEVIGGAQWADFADLPNLDHALAIARALAARAQANPYSPGGR